MEKKQRRREHRAHTIGKESLWRKAVSSKPKNQMEDEGELFKSWDGWVIEERI